MACDTQTRTIVRPVWTNGTTTAIFIPFVRLAESELASLRISYQLESGANIEIVPATRGTKDGWTYPDAVAEWTGATYTSTTGWTYGGAYNAPNDDYQQIEFGFNVRNTSGTNRNGAMATLVLDVRK